MEVELNEIEQLSQDFSQQSLLEPLSPNWGSIENQLDEDLNRAALPYVPLEHPATDIEETDGEDIEGDEQVDTDFIPANQVIQSVIDNPIPLSTNSLLNTNPLKPADWLLDSWENKNYGGVYSDYRPKIVPWKSQSMSTLQVLKEMERLQSASYNNQVDKYNRLKKLARNLKTTLYAHQFAIDDLKEVGCDVETAIKLISDEICIVKEDSKTRMESTHKQLTETRKRIKYVEDVDEDKKQELKESSNVKVKQIKAMISQIEELELNPTSTCSVDPEELKKVRREWCGVINDMRRLKVPIPNGTYKMVEMSKKAIDRIERIIDHQRTMFIPDSKRRRLNPVNEKIM